MAILQILSTTKGDKTQQAVLHRPTEPVTKFDESLTHLVEDLIETMKNDIICIGLAAPQVGISLQVAVVCPDRDFSNVKVLINPANIIKSGKKDIKRESCMSLPDLGGNVERRKRLSVDVRTLAGGTATLQFEGFEARAAAHELDHLSGTMYSDKADTLVALDFDAIRSKLSG